jgi:typhasterol/6-deoxotyphasterol 2alpha-hydroxylase
LTSHFQTLASLYLNAIKLSVISHHGTAASTGLSSIVPMELPPWASFLGIVLATVMLLKALTGRRSRRMYNLPPGPKPWPIIGNLDLVGALPHRSIHELSRKYGPLMQLRFGSFPVVVGSSVDMAKFFLKTHDVVFTDRPKTAAGKYTTYNYRDITWSPYGAYWRQARKMCLTELFSAKRLESYEYIRADEVRALLRDLHAASSSGRAVMLKDYLSTVSLNVITRMVLGKKYLDKEEAAAAGGSVTTPEEFKWMLDELFLLNGVLNIGDSIPWLDWMDLQGYIKRMKKLSKMFDRFLEHVVEEHNQRRLREGKGFVAKDMVDVLLQIADDPTLEVELDRESVKAFTQVSLEVESSQLLPAVGFRCSELIRCCRILRLLDNYSELLTSCCSYTFVQVQLL